MGEKDWHSNCVYVSSIFEARRIYASSSFPLLLSGLILVAVVCSGKSDAFLLSKRHLVYHRLEQLQVVILDFGCAHGYNDSLFGRLETISCTITSRFSLSALPPSLSPHF